MTLMSIANYEQLTDRQKKAARTALMTDSERKAAALYRKQ